MLLLKKIKHRYIFTLLIGIGVSCGSEGDFQFDDLNISKGGSMSQFYIEQNFLYVIEETTLSIFDIINSTPVLIANLDIRSQAETIAKLNSTLLIGTTTGVLFYDVSNPESPFKISEYVHITSCDPVVSDGQYAFITLRSGRNCGEADNVLEIIDISDLKNPVLVSSYPMVSPYGLALMGTNLFVGESYNGMSWFDVSDVSNIILLKAYSEIMAIDFIVNGNDLTITTKNSLLQMKLTDTNELVKLSEMIYAEN